MGADRFMGGDGVPGGFMGDYTVYLSLKKPFSTGPNLARVNIRGQSENFCPSRRGQRRTIARLAGLSNETCAFRNGDGIESLKNLSKPLMRKRFCTIEPFFPRYG
jgi:hypothetical protein